MIDRIGRSAVAAVRAAGRFGQFLADLAHAIPDVATWGSLALVQMRRIGVDSLPVALFIAAFTGIVLALQASYTFTGTVPLYVVGAVVGKTMMLELGPVLTGLALAGRVGASIAAELGTMRVTEQVDALETLAYDPLAYLVLPRLIAGTLMLPVVVVLGIVVGIITGWITSMGLLDLSTRRVRQGPQVPLSLQGRLVRADQERQLRVHDHAGRVPARARHTGRGGRCGAQHHASGGRLGDADPGARRVLGGGAPVIRFRELRKAFDGHVVLDGFTLDVRDGETMVIIGLSGSGKSVALKHVVGLLHPDAGDVIVDGRAVSTLDRPALMALRREIGYVFQFAALFDSMTVAENVALGLRRRGLSDAAIAQRVAEALALVDLAGTDGRYPAELSGGMRKRVGIARAIALQPRYILYDEPTTGLDPVTSAVIEPADGADPRASGGHRHRRDARHASARTRSGIASRCCTRGGCGRSARVAEIQATTDPVVRQFIEGRPE